MDKLDTYNRVPRLESPRNHWRLVVRSTLLVISALLIFICHWLFELSWEYALGGMLCILFLFLGLERLARISPNRCRFCKTELDRVVRPLLITPELLATPGQKHGDYYFVQKKSVPWMPPHWVKLSNQSQVCHYCRLTEEFSSETLEPPSQEELEWLNNQQKELSTD